MKTLGVTQSTCSTCRRIIPTKIVAEDDDVYFHKFCPEHGASRHLVRTDVEDYLRTQRYVKPAWTPEKYAGDSSAPCPTGCGFCDRHEQHLCMPIIEITSRCDLACPVCLVDAGDDWDMTLSEYSHLLDVLIDAEKQVDVLNLSGGEPLIHPQLLDILDEALLRKEIVRVSISTNGLALLEKPELLDQLKQRNVVVSLQFDGFDDKAYKILRGRELLAEKLSILEKLGEWDISTSLTVTAAGGVNDDQFGRILEYFFAQPNVVSMMIQPIAFAGRGAELTGKAGRLSIPDITRLIGSAGASGVSASDFAPLPCSHPLCFALAYYLVCDDGSTVSLNQLLGASWVMDTLANRAVFGLDEGEHDRVKDMIYELWSGPAGAAPDSETVMKTLRSILDELAGVRFDPRQAFTVTERRIKSIFVHAFQDAETFDLDRVRRCCNAYPQPDGRMMPVCVYNVLRRNSSATGDKSSLLRTPNE